MTCKREARKDILGKSGSDLEAKQRPFSAAPAALVEPSYSSKSILTVKL